MPQLVNKSLLSTLCSGETEGPFAFPCSFVSDFWSLTGLPNLPCHASQVPLEAAFCQPSLPFPSAESCPTSCRALGVSVELFLCFLPSLYQILPSALSPLLTVLPMRCQGTAQL